MADTTPKGFIVWDEGTDPFRYEELAANWELLDDLLDVPPRRVQIITALSGAGGPADPPAAGDLAMTSTPIQSWPSLTLLKYTGTEWRAAAGVELMAAVPTQNNFIGRIVMLTANSGAFIQGDLIRNLDGANSWKLVSPFAAFVNGGVDGHSAPGDVIFLGANRGPVLIDRSTGTRYRLFFNNGGLYSEIVP